MRRTNFEAEVNQTTKTQYFISFLLKEFRNSVKFFLQTQKGVGLIVSVLKFSSPYQKNYFFSLLGFLVPRLNRFHQGPFFVAKLSNYLGVKQKKIMIKILTGFFFRYLFSPCQIQIFDLIFQCFFNKGEKELSKIILCLDKESCFFSKKKFFLKSLEVFRLIYSGFSERIKKKISEMIIEFCYFFLENVPIISLGVSQEILWAGLRMSPKKIFYTFKKKSFNSLAFMNNSVYGLIILSELLERNTTLKIKRINRYFLNFLPKFLNDKYGHIFILLLLFRKNPKKNFLKKEIFSTISFDSRFHIISCLAIIRIFSRNFFKKKLYKILTKKKKKKTEIFEKIEKILNQEEFLNFLKKITTIIRERNNLNFSFFVLLKNLFGLTYFKKKNFYREKSLFLRKMWVSRKSLITNDPKFILKSSNLTRLERKVIFGQKVLIFIFLVFLLRDFSEKKKKFLFFNQEKSLLFSINSLFLFCKGKKIWKVWIGTQIKITTNLFWATENLIRNPKNY